jgi:hypothetical protein
MPVEESELADMVAVAERYSIFDKVNVDVSEMK